ncbi:MAG: DUF6172 family protein [Myxococcota bacterium]
MRKTHALTHPRHAPPQALAAVKNTLRKYVKRERRKELPEGADYWDFDCRVGLDEASATPAHVAEVVKRVDALAAEGALEVYVEILAKPARRTKRPAS